eukprot:scaffold5024_cov136-Cylindrotheca_fusiformis.AAC.11
MITSKLFIVALVVAFSLTETCLLSVDAARTFVGWSSARSVQSNGRTPFLVRGGASAILEDDDVSEIESSDYDEEEEDELVKSAQSTMMKKTKKAVASSLAATKPQKKKKSFLKIPKLPYIIGACLNPVVVAQMIKGSWLQFSAHYMFAVVETKDPSENLRSALQEKAKKGGGGSTRGKRKMKRGRSKSLSDLPQLNT